MGGSQGAVGSPPGEPERNDPTPKPLESAPIAIDGIGTNAPMHLSKRRIFFDFIWIADLLVCVSAGYLGDWLYHTLLSGGGDGNPRIGLLFGLGLGTVYVLYSHRMRRYEPVAMLSPSSLAGLVEPVLRAWGIAVFTTVTITYLLKLGDELARGTLIIASLVALTGLVLSRRFIANLARRLTRSGRPLSLRVAVIGVGDRLQEVLSDLRTEQSGMDIIEVTARQSVGLFLTPEGQTDLRGFIAKARSAHAEQIIFACSAPEIADARRVVDLLSVSGIPVGVAFDRQFHRLLDYGLEQIGPTPYVQIRPHTQYGVQGLLKRIFDIVFSAVVLMCLIPVFAVIAAAIKLDSRGPVIFRQRRHGLGHKVFTIFKFRSMTTEDDGDHVKQATRRDPRVTRVGGFLRRTSLDELPQFMNVLLGDMSVVGPRPHALTHNRQHASEVEMYALRHNVKPGITGWAQVNGFRGETASLDQMKARVEHDLWYIRNWSLWLDIKIVVMTVMAVLLPRNAY